MAFIPVVQSRDQFQSIEDLHLLLNGLKILRDLVKYNAHSFSLLLKIIS